MQIDLKSILFLSTAQSFLSYIITIAMYYIYKSKFHIKKLSIKGFENYLKQKFLNEMYIVKWLSFPVGLSIKHYWQ